MLAVMYHYVRPREKHLRYSHFMELDAFRAQLDKLAAEQGAIDQQDFFRIIDGQRGIPDKGFVLTFDDGLKDHYRYVLPELIKRGLWGMFFISSGPYWGTRILNVHALHLLLGKYGGEKVLKHLEEVLEAGDIEKEYVARFQEKMYKPQKQDQHETRVKRLLNFYVRKDALSPILDRLAASLGESLDLGDEYYLSRDEITEMDSSGMLMGAHGKSHDILSQLSREGQETEIIDSLELVADIVGPNRPRSFCYPHGQPYTYTEETVEILKNNSCRFAFAVGNRSFEQGDIGEPFALPRYDCAMLDLSDR